ncbi:unnamed protein product [Caenorhabditis bovis]|uniref:Interferon-related developmental regulator N-terminal domain-containing protein n=1 Tax=Caenorhabditis bovis TaxID=2654633 RepID=A0A8S1F2L5_9PELO|nr:unnamed protein product [Caenorhabditis bovis]
MGKGRNKNKDKDAYSGPQRPRLGRHDSDSDESVSTHLTFDDDLSSVQGDIENLDDVFDKLTENLDNATHKNVSIRTSALDGLIFALTSQYVPEFVLRNKMTLVSLANKLDNKTEEEATRLAVLVSLVAIQAGEEISDLIEDPLSQMRTILMDLSKSSVLRGTCALSMAVTSRISCENEEIIAANIKACRFAWTNIRNNSPNSKLFSICLQSWCLLLLDGDYSTIKAATDDQPKIVGYLNADQLDIRITAGEALAFLHEYMQEAKPGYSRFPNHDTVLEIFEGLIGDTTKRKTKKDKRIQRFSFREIYAYLNDDEDTPEVNIKFGEETLVLNSCTIKLIYDLLCEVLHGGMMKQLQKNEVLREVFGLGTPQLTSDSSISKISRMAYHDATQKARNQIRGKQRDKRTAAY